MAAHADFDALAGARHPDPFAVLGPHVEGGAVVIRAYHPTAKLPDTEPALLGLYQSVLQDQRALLLMDNAASAAQVEPLIPPAGCVLLVTSRAHFTLPGLYAKNLEALSSEDARERVFETNRLANVAPPVFRVELRTGKGQMKVTRCTLPVPRNR